MVRILVVDDDPKFRAYVRSGLGGRGIDSEDAQDGGKALEVLAERATGHYDLVLLDVMMPNASGWQVLEEMRARGDETPVIFVTARDAVEERVRGLELGADDYIIKPFDFVELMARIDAVIRRYSQKLFMQCGPLSIDLVQRKVTIGSNDYDLATKEFDLLMALARAGGEVITRTALLKDVWGIEFDPETNLVDVYIARLRRRLRPDGSSLITTVRGEGYALQAPCDD